MKVWITGICGFLGSHLADALIAEGHQVWGNDNLIGGDASNIKLDCAPTKDDVFWANADCHKRRRLKEWFDWVKPDVLYHCAALAHEGLSVFSPALISDSILGGSASVFSAAIAAGVKRIVFMSSMARYGVDNLNNEPFVELYKRPIPVDPYGICKVAAEDLLRFLCNAHGVEYVIAVPHNIYGPRQKYDDPFRNVAAIMANRMLQGKPPIIYGDGEQRRCFSYIDDVVLPLVKMATQANVVGEVINIGPDEGTVTINELAQALGQIILRDPDCEKQYVEARPAEVKFATCSADKARRLLDYRAKTSLFDGLVKLVEHIRERGPKPFDYKLPIEIQNDLTPKTWSERTI